MGQTLAEWQHSLLLAKGVCYKFHLAVVLTKEAGSVSVTWEHGTSLSENGLPVPAE